MASADLRDELTCSICLNIYTDPVTLPCAHSFCRLCIVGVLDTQDGSGVYTCPECRAESQERPALEKNRKLGNIAESFRSSHQEQEEVGIPCTYCDSPVPAAKTCLHCEASLCDKHLKKHSKSEEHVLTEPTMSLGNRKCSVHKKVLEYYCYEDAACICVSCSLAGEHGGHRVETLNEASKKKIKKLRNILQKLTSQREEAEKRVQSLEELRGQEQEKASRVTKEATGLIKDIREQLEALEKRVLSEISRQEEQVSLRFSDLIRQLEIKKEELSRKMDDIEELCDMTDPVTVLQGRESDRADYCDAEEDTETRDIRVHDVGDLDVGLILVTLLLGLAGIMTRIKTLRIVPGASDTLVNGNTTSGMLLGVINVTDMILDLNTAGECVSVSGDLKSVSDAEINQRPRETPERFQYRQVLSSQSFSSGRHYWEVEGNGLEGWMVRVAYPSIARKGDQSRIGRNNKSWGLEIGGILCFHDLLSVIHDSKVTQIPQGVSCQRLGILLDYEAGRLSFYELCVPIRHLHTFTAAFTEPLHAVFGLCLSWVRVM